MRQVEALIRTTELLLILVSTYLTAVTLLKSSFFDQKLKPLLAYVVQYLRPLHALFRPYFPYFELMVLALVVIMALLFWRRGDEVGFGRIFMLNMFMYFPTVIDFSIFNWVELIMPYESEITISPLWALCVGVLLQITYLTLRYTVRFRALRSELVKRGAEIDDLNAVSKNQMVYLGLLMAATSIIVIMLHFAIPIIKSFLSFKDMGIPYSHVVLGLACTVMIVSAMYMYLKGQRESTSMKDVMSVKDVRA